MLQITDLIPAVSIQTPVQEHQVESQRFRKYISNGLL